MVSENRPARPGCGPALLITAMVSWLGVAPVSAMFLAGAALSTLTTTSVIAVAATVVAAALLAPVVGVVLSIRRRPGWRQATAVGSTVVAISGYLVLDAAMRGMSPEIAPQTRHWEGALASGLRLACLSLYVVLAAWFVPRLAVAQQRPVWAWLGLGKPDLPTWLLAALAAALVTIPWPVTGALGDRLTSLSLVVQSLAQVIPQVMLFWGLTFCLLTSTFANRRVAAIVTIVLFGVSRASSVLPSGDWGELAGSAVLLPLGFLLTELRAREGGIYSALAVAFCYHVAPRLFVDPRDAIAQGIPELQHIVGQFAAVATVFVLGVLLLGGRWLMMALRDRVQVSGMVASVVVGIAALASWVIWGGVYALAGEPGFADDGFLIVLEEQADLGVGYAVPDREERLELVHDVLIETAERSQAPLRARLDEMGVPYRPYYIINMIRVDGRSWLMSRFRDEPGVARVILNPNVREYPRRIPLPYGGDTGSTGGIQPNLAAVRAGEAWALGVTGEGIVVAGQDTGYDWTHPALKSHYRGWNGQNGTHDYNWHDAWDDTPIPFDDDAHGTHTMGTVLGDDGLGNRTGVAPDAQWIGCRNMRRGFGSPGAYAECMEFFLAPYPHGSDSFADGETGRAPHVVNNSWGCPDFEGCFPDTLKPAVEALRAAGIMMVVSAGNDGPACGTASTPPANYDAVFSVGATNDSLTISGFSSRGPVDGLVKPDVSAPGHWIRSSVPGGGYGYAGGTSMAGPHVAGLVALVWSANPALIADIEGTEDLICRTAVPKAVESACAGERDVPEGLFGSMLADSVCACGGAVGVPNNVYGCGAIDAGAAVHAAISAD